MLRIYRAPNGATYQYEEGEQPDGYELADEQPAGAEPEPEAKPKPARKARTAANKARTTKNK